MLYQRLKETIEENRAKDRVAAKAMQNKADIDYISMMTGIEIPVVESEVEHNEQEV